MLPSNPLSRLLDEILRLTGSHWAVLASVSENGWSFQEGSINSSENNRIIQELEDPKNRNVIFSSLYDRKTLTLSLGRGNYFIKWVHIFPINDQSAVIVGTNKKSLQFPEIWLSLAETLDEIYFNNGQLPGLQNTLQELENAQQELQARITAQEAAESKLIQTTKLAAVGEMAAGVAHELNNPLTTVVGFSELVLESTPEDSPIRDDLTVVLQEARRARDVVRRLLDFSRQSETVKTKADINEVVQDVVSLMQHLFHINQITIDVQYESGLPWVMMDINQMKQVFLNLFHNALNAMPNGGTLSISTSAEIRYGSPYVAVSVKDTGMGIPEDNLPRIFEPFFTTRADQGGTGLGLSVTYGIVTDHGGTIEVESTSGNGSKFVVLLPVKNG